MDDTMKNAEVKRIEENKTPVRSLKPELLKRNVRGFRYKRRGA